jgi:hypothetical protein
VRNRGSLTAWVAAALVALAVSWLFLAPWHGPIIVSLSDTHGIDLGDLPALALIAFAVAGLARAREPRPSAAGRRRAVLGVSAAAAALGVLLLLAGTLHTFTPPALLPAGGGTFDGDTEHADSGRADPIDHWSHVAVTYDGATIRLYLDGRPVSSRAMHGQVLHTNEPLWIGGNHPYGEYFDGDIDEVRVYDRALTGLQIRRAMSTPIAGGRDARTAGLIGAYALNSRPRASVTDASGHGNSGAILGATWTPRGRFGGAMRFDGRDDAVRVPASQSLDLTHAMTLSAWIRPSEPQSGWRTILHRQTDAYFLDAGGGHLGENTIEGVDDARAVLAAAAIAWLCVALAGGSAQGLKAHVGPWWAITGLFLAGSLLDAAFAPAGTAIAPALVAIWLGVRAPGRAQAAIAFVIAAGCAAVTAAALAAPAGSALGNDLDATSRSVALGVLFVLIGVSVGYTGAARANGPTSSITPTAPSHAA